MIQATSLRSFTVLLVGLVAAGVLPAWNVQADLITTIKDSADFPYLYDGADVPNLNGWSLAYGEDTVATASGTQMIIDTTGARGVWHNEDTAGTLSHAAGYTVEIRYQITRDDGSGIGAWGALLADDAVGNLAHNTPLVNHANSP